jgi:threonine synthase
MGRSYLTKLECSHCGQSADPSQLQTVCPVCGKVLFARYDLRAASQAMTQASLASREKTMWRSRETLPVMDDIRVSVTP